MPRTLFIRKFVKSCKKSNSAATTSTTNEISESDLSIVSHVLTNFPSIIEKIFRYLNAEDLTKCSCVCQEWRHTAAIVKKRRQEPIIVYEYGQSTTTGDQKFHTKQLIEKLKYALKMTYTVPHFGIVFVCNMEPADVRVIETFLHSGIPTCSSNFSISYYRLAALLGIYATPQRHSTLKTPCISAIFFPEYIPGVKFYQFKIVEEFPPALNSADVIPNVTGIPRDTRVKCFILFKASPFYIVRSNLLLDPTKGIINYYMSQENNRIAMAGTQAGFTHFLPCGPKGSAIEEQEKYLGLGLAITGDQFDAASIVINHDCIIKSKLLEKINMLKNGIRLREKTYGLLFTSVKSQENWYESENLESQCFKEVFPGIPLIGVRSNGMFNTKEIIGNTYLPAKDFVEMPNSDPTYIYHKCLSFIVLTWGKEI